jgi:hypothetical protein
MGSLVKETGDAVGVLIRVLGCGSGADAGMGGMGCFDMVGQRVYKDHSFVV